MGTLFILGKNEKKCCLMYMKKLKFHNTQFDKAK
jgi:hypothetical protein